VKFLIYQLLVGRLKKHLAYIILLQSHIQIKRKVEVFYAFCCKLSIKRISGKLKVEWVHEKEIYGVTVN